MTAVTLDQTSFQELVFKASKNCKHSGGIDCQQVRSTGQNLFFIKLKLVTFGCCTTTTVNDVKAQDKFTFLVVFCLFLLLPNLTSKLIDNQPM